MESPRQTRWRKANRDVVGARRWLADQFAAACEHDHSCAGVALCNRQRRRRSRLLYVVDSRLSKRRLLGSLPHCARRGSGFHCRVGDALSWRAATGGGARGTGAAAYWSDRCRREPFVHGAASDQHQHLFARDGAGGGAVHFRLFGD